MLYPSKAVDTLARLHYGLPAYPADVSGRQLGARKSILTRLRLEGYIEGDQVTENGYAYLRMALQVKDRQHG